MKIKWSGGGIVGRIVGTLFFAVFAAAGLFFCWLVVRDTFETIQTYSWTRTECLILESKVAEPQSPFRVTVRYQYEWQGKTFSSEKFSRHEKTFSEYIKAQRLANQFPIESRSTCFINPADPSQAILHRQSLWSALLVFFPLIFVAIGFGGMYAIWRGNKTPTAQTASTSPLTTRARAGWGSAGLGIFFFLFFMAGAGVAYAMAIQPLWKIQAAKSWRQVPCTIISSRVQSHSSDDGTTYSIEIFYAYEFNGQEYKSSRYHFLGGSSSGYEGKAAVVRRYPPGTKAVCYVNPRDPLEAVLERGFVSAIWFGILFPIPFLAVGIGGLLYVARNARGNQHGTVPKANAAWGKTPIQFPMNNQSQASHGPLTLNPRSSRWGKFGAGVLVALFWNGLLSVFIWQMVASWLRHDPEYFLTIFLIPFELVGLLLIGYVVYGFLALFNPVVQLQLASPALKLGGTLHLRWKVKGAASRITNLRIYLEGREETTYRRGTSQVTDKNVFATIELANVSHQLQIPDGSAQARIPADTMHSFSSTNNKIIWTLCVRGDIPRWPDVQDEYALALRPIPLDELSKV